MVQIRNVGSSKEKKTWVKILRKKEKKCSKKTTIFSKLYQPIPEPQNKATNLGKKKNEKNTSSLEDQEPAEHGGHSVFPNPAEKIFQRPTGLVG